MRIAAKVDRNHAEIVAAFRKLGCSVLQLYMVGKGCPDIAVSKNLKTAMVEIKDGSKKMLTKDEEKFHKSWQGLIFVVCDLGDVIALVNGLER